MKKFILGLTALLSFSAFADQSGAYICRNIDVFDGGTRIGSWKVTVSTDLKAASIVFSDDFNIDYNKISFPSFPVFKLKQVGTNWGHLRFEEIISYEGLTSSFSFNLMGSGSASDNLQSKDAVLTQIQDNEKSAHLCVKI